MQTGFRVLGFDDLTNWRPVYPFDYTIESHEDCPSCGTAFDTVAAIVSLTTAERIRVGCCPLCGLVGYIDRPSQADIDRYYAETWMGETVEQATEKAEAIKRQQPAHRLVGILADQKLPSLEIGCGYGGMVHSLQRHGFAVHATEQCPARAEAVRRTFGVQVTPEIPDERYGLIYSSHVLEHVADPAGLIKACAARQDEGSYLVLQMPAFHWEPSIGVLMFLPHLWSFRSRALRYVLWANGYQVVNESRADASDLFVIARRTTRTPDAFPEPEGDLPYATVRKLLSGLGMEWSGPTQLKWQRNFDGAVLTPERYANQERQAGFPRTMTIEPVQRFRTSAPIEIQYQGRVQLFHK